jgi:four helix bundle protein
MNRYAGTHKDLHVWQVAMHLVVITDTTTSHLPDSERFGLISQMRRAAVTVPSNIAEGAARSSSADFARFLVSAKGFLAEWETQIALVERFGFCEVDTDCMIAGLHDY